MLPFQRRSRVSYSRDELEIGDIFAIRRCYSRFNVGTVKDYIGLRKSSLINFNVALRIRLTLLKIFVLNMIVEQAVVCSLKFLYRILLA